MFSDDTIHELKQEVIRLEKENDDLRMRIRYINQALKDASLWSHVNEITKTLTELND